MKDVIATHLESTFESRVCEGLVESSWNLGDKRNYDRNLGLDCSELFEFIKETQRQNWDRLIDLHGDANSAQLKFSTRLGSELDQRGTIDVLRRGIVDLGVRFDLAYFVPAHDLTPENREKYQSNRVTLPAR